MKFSNSLEQFQGWKFDSTLCVSAFKLRKECEKKGESCLLSSLFSLKVKTGDNTQGSPTL